MTEKRRYGRQKLEHSNHVGNRMIGKRGRFSFQFGPLMLNAKGLSRGRLAVKNLNILIVGGSRMMGKETRSVAKLLSQPKIHYKL